MKPVKKKYRKRDWKRSRRYKNIAETFGENWWDDYRIESFYPKKELRRVGNRKVRRYKSHISNGCSYKKIYDVMWEVI